MPDDTAVALLGAIHDQLARGDSRGVDRVGRRLLGSVRLVTGIDIGAFHRFCHAANSRHLLLVPIG